MDEGQTKVQDIINAIGRMTDELAKLGISKDKQNTDQKYKFRGIDDVRNVIAPLQEKCALVIIPRMVGREQHERTTKSGGFALQVIVKIEFDFISRKDGSKITVPMENEAVDYSDKATNKAVSQAYKTVCINTFNIPTEGEDDTDEEKKELKGKKVGVFENSGLRDMYVENCIKTFNDCETSLRLNDAESLYHEKLILMRHSEDPEDKAAVTKIEAIYSERKKALATAQKPKLATVETAMNKG